MLTMIPLPFLIEKESEHKNPFDQLELVYEPPLQNNIPMVIPDQTDDADVPHVIEIQL